MTDKQIKDGIDVSQCECYSVEDNSCNDTLSGSCMKENCTLCDYSDKCHIEDEEIPTYDVCKLILQKISECEGSDE
jgi:hypothetical protein